MRRFKLVFTPGRTDWCGRTYFAAVAAKLGWVNPEAGLAALYVLEVGQVATDDDGWIWERQS